MESFEDLIGTTADDRIENEQLLAVQNRLSAHMNNKYFFKVRPFKNNKGVKIYEVYEGKNLRQSYYEQCIFEDANLKNTGLAGSVFKGCSFKPCDFTDTNFQSCCFKQCFFENLTLQYTRMNKTSFYKTKFLNCIFLSTSINDAVFEDCEFINCKWTTSVENTIFKNTLFENVKFKNMNFEFATFDNIKTINVKFPFPTIPFIYNGLNYILTTKDNVRITSAQQTEGLTKEEYKHCIKDLEQFYSETKNYFPLTNIYIAQERYDKALSSISLGINLAIKLHAFRMIKYYCKQTQYINNITPCQRKKIYSSVLKNISLENIEDFEKDILNLYLPEIKDLLLNDRRGRVQILIRTNIEEYEFDKLTIFLSSLDELLKKKYKYTIELRHNSPFEVFLEIFSDPKNIIVLINIMIVIMNLISSSMNLKANSINLKQNYEKKIEKKDEEKCKQICNNMLSNNITINNFYILNNGSVSSVEFVNQNSVHGDMYRSK